MACLGGKFPQLMPLSHTNSTMMAMHAPMRQGGVGSLKGGKGGGVALAGVAPKFGSEKAVLGNYGRDPPNLRDRTKINIINISPVLSTFSQKYLKQGMC